MDRRRPAVPLDLHDKHGTGTATPTRPNMSKDRKRTLMNLLDALKELQDDDLASAHGPPHRRGTHVLDEPGDGPNVDEHIQTEGAVAFERFQRRVKELDRELQSFSNAVTQLGSSVGLLSSAMSLRRRLMRILHLVRENAAGLFPRKVRRDTPHSGDSKRVLDIRTRLHLRFKPPPNVTHPTLSEGELEAESFPDEIVGLAEDTVGFLDCLNEFPEFSDEHVNASILAFEGDLKYWASCLKEFEGQFRFPGVTRYVHDLSMEMGEHLEHITAALIGFVEVGVPTIRFVQKHGSSNLLNLSTIATFFSAVTATTIQFSFNVDNTPLQQTVNAFWYSSLVFSIASAVNSLLGLTWKQAMYRSPGHRVPWWVLIWIKRSPLIFLVVAVVAFSVGLVLFTWTQPARWVAIIVTAFTTFSLFGLIAVSSWFAFERWTYSRHNGAVWFDQVLAEVQSKLHIALGIQWVTTVPPRHIKRAATWSSTQLTRTGTTLFRVTSRRLSTLRPTGVRSSTDTEATAMPPLPMHIRQDSGMSSRGLLSSPISIERTTSPPPLSPDAPPLPQAPPPVVTHFAPAQTAANESGEAPRARLRSAVRAVINLRAAAPATPTKGLELVLGNGAAGLGTPKRVATTLAPLTAGRLARNAVQRAALNQLAAAANLQAHQALVRHLAFSPNGCNLATCSWDRTATIVRVGPDVSGVAETERVLAHPLGFVGQVAWSPNGRFLLTKLTRGVKVWTEEGVCKKTIDRHTSVSSITWFPNNEEFLSIETHEAVHLDIKGRIIDRHPFERLGLHDVAIMPDGLRFLAVATLKESREGLTPVKARSEKRIVVYHRKEKQIEYQVPVVHDVRDITISRSGHLALVSYEHKAPPQVWRIDMFRDDARLTLRHTYMPHRETDFAGPSYFGGKDDQLVLCASKAGDIHIWDRESGALLRHIPPEPGDGDLTCIAWNVAADTLMFATGSHDGTVRIWTADQGAAQGLEGSVHTDEPDNEEDADDDESGGLQESPLDDFPARERPPDLPRPTPYTPAMFNATVAVVQAQLAREVAREQAATVAEDGRGGDAANSYEGKGASLSGGGIGDS